MDSFRNNITCSTAILNAVTVDYDHDDFNLETKSCTPAAMIAFTFKANSQNVNESITVLVLDQPSDVILISVENEVWIVWTIAILLVTAIIILALALLAIIAYNVKKYRKENEFKMMNIANIRPVFSLTIQQLLDDSTIPRIAYDELEMYEQPLGTVSLLLVQLLLLLLFLLLYALLLLLLLLLLILFISTKYC